MSWFGGGGDDDGHCAPAVFGRVVYKSNVLKIEEKKEEEGGVGNLADPAKLTASQLAAASHRRPRKLAGHWRGEPPNR